jgi:arginine N-succinyltransferase
MSIVVRPVKKEDLSDLLNLAREFVLLNLPPNKHRLEEMISLSEKSFEKEVEKDEREYIFVAEDIHKKRAIATAKVVTKKGTPEDPNIYYKILKKEKFSKSLGIGFIHQILKYCEDSDGPTELGGLVVSRGYRGHPNKIGKLVSLTRFLYIAMNKDDFKTNLHTELAPPLDSEGRSEFWEALGRRFTGLPYDEADRLSHLDKEFITSLFPENEIYTSLLDPKARMAIGQVGAETKPALRLMESFGFKYKHEIDPFDGGPYMGVVTDEAKPIKALKEYKVSFKNKISSDQDILLLGGWGENGFRALTHSPEIQGDTLFITQEVNSCLNFVEGQRVFVVPFNYN